MNKLKIGNRVQLKDRVVNWHLSHLEIYGIGGKIDKDSYEELALLFLAKSRRSKIKGSIIGYGALDDAFKNKRNYVNVKFNYKGMTTSFYCSENDLKKL